MSFNQPFLRMFQTVFFLQYFIFWEFKPFLIFFFFNTWFFKHQLQHLVCNNLKRFLETSRILFMTLRNFGIWIFDEESNVLFLIIILRKKCSKFFSENLRKFLVLNGLCFVWPILSPKIYFYCHWLPWLTVLKKLLFWPMSATEIWN